MDFFQKIVVVIIVKNLFFFNLELHKEMNVIFLKENRISCLNLEFFEELNIKPSMILKFLPFAYLISNIVFLEPYVALFPPYYVYGSKFFVVCAHVCSTRFYRKAERAVILRTL